VDYLVRDILSILKDEGFDLIKETHPNKTFMEHAKECSDLAIKLVRKFYHSDVEKEELERFVVVLSVLHDLGKLNTGWSLTLRRRPPHSPKSAEWILKCGKGRWLSGCYDELLAYFVRMHHSSLLHYSLLRRRWFNPKVLKCISKEKKIKLVDAFGIFKLADLASAAGIPQNSILKQYEWLNGLKARIEAGIRERAEEKVKKVDERKFSFQKEIAGTVSKHLMVAAPTGWGKTALALLRAAYLRPYKVFYILPTITAIKDFYDTLCKILPDDYVGEYFYFADVELLRGIRQSEDYTLNLYRYFIPKFMITTIDQLLFMLLQVGRYYIRRFNLKNSLLIFDEYHLFTPQMIGALRLFIKSLADYYDVSCLFMSATPSPLYQKKLSEVLPDLKSYVLKSEYKEFNRHKIKLIPEKVPEFIGDISRILESKRTLIILNTVKGAQRVYQALRECFGTKKHVTLLHGEFAYKDRSKRENEINNTDILVSTQVAEVSLDISFDCLITERAPLPSLIQRFGRVNRYGGTPEETNIYICECETDKPYGSLKMSWLAERLEDLVEGLEREREAAYLNENFWDFEQLYEEDIDNSEAVFEQRLKNLDYFYSVLAEVREISKNLGREESWLVVPELYINQVRDLKRRLLHVRNYDEKRRIYAEIKEYFVPISRSNLKNYRQDDELELPVIKNYSEELGVLIP